MWDVDPISDTDPIIKYRRFLHNNNMFRNYQWIYLQIQYYWYYQLEILIYDAIEGPNYFNVKKHLTIYKWRHFVYYANIPSKLSCLVAHDERKIINVYNINFVNENRKPEICCISILIYIYLDAFHNILTLMWYSAIHHSDVFKGKTSLFYDSRIKLDFFIYQLTVIKIVRNIV